MTENEKRNAPAPESLAIIGMGCLFPKADSPEMFWSNVAAGVDAIGDVPHTHWRPDDYYEADPTAPDRTYARRGGFLDPVDFDPLLFGISPNNIEATDTTQLLGMYVARQALRDAGYETADGQGDGRPFDRDRTSVILGVTGALELVIPLGARLGHPLWRRALEQSGVDRATADEAIRRISEGYVPWQENSFPGLLGNVAAGRIANRFDLGGTNCVVDAACASSLSAIHMAAMELQSGRADAVVAGGLDTFNDIFMYMCFSKTPALSPTGDSRPFSADGDGTILGEGLGVVVLKRESDARRDGDKIYALLRAIGTSSDGRGNAVYAPSAAGQKKAINRAYAEAQVRPATIELVEAHGTGTKVGDAVEASALVETYRADKGDGRWCAVGSVKSMIGHTKAAAGVAGMMKAALALHHKTLPPSIKVQKPLDALAAADSPLYVNIQQRPWLPRTEHPRRAAVSAFGFGGSNFHCLLEEASSEKSEPTWDGAVQVLAFASADRASLIASLERFDASAAWPNIRRRAAELRRDFHAGAAVRLLIPIECNGADLKKTLAEVALRLRSATDDASWRTPNGACFGAGRPGRLAALFPGQGSQRVGMLRDLACQFPQMLESLSAADCAFGPQACGERLSDHVYPLPTFDDAGKNEIERRLRDTRVTQPALAAVSFGAWRLLQYFGVAAYATAGHSFGEMTALAAANWIDEAALHRLACIRGRLMAEAGGGRGAMLAVSIERSEIERLVAESGWRLSVANHNGPKQVVLSGDAAEIERADRELSRQKIAARRLDVSGAFHSSLVAAAEASLLESLGSIEIRPTEIEVFANTTAELFPRNVADVRRIVAGQVARSVEFVRQIETMIASGVRTFVEVGPGRTLASLVRSIDERGQCQIVALDASRGDRRGDFDLASCLSQLSAAGHAVDWSRWDGGYLNRPVDPPSGMTIPLSGANYVKPRIESPTIAPTKAEPPTRPIERPAAAAQAAVASPPPAAPKPAPSVSQSLSRTTQLKSTPLASPMCSTPPTTAPNQSAIAATEQSILALQKMQEQTAQLHRQYLENQAVAQQTIASLVEQQQRWLAGSPVVFAPTVEAPSRNRPIPAPIEAVVQSPALSNANQSVAPPPAAPTPVAPLPLAPTSAAPPASASSFEQALLEAVAEKTGYPVDMLALEMSLDADLGIDSIKRVEILSAMQEKMPDAPHVSPDDLGRLQTLGQVVDYLTTAAPRVAVDNQTESVSQATSNSARHDSAKLEQLLLETVAEKTGYPVDMLVLEMALDADLGVDSIKRVEILSAMQERVPEATVVAPEQLGQLRTLGDVVAAMTAGAMMSPAPSSPSGEPPRTSPSRTAMPSTISQTAPSFDRLEWQTPVLRPLSEDRPRSFKALPGPIWIVGPSDALADALQREWSTRNVVARRFEFSNSEFSAATLSESPGGLIVVAPAALQPSVPEHVLRWLQQFSASSSDKLGRIVACITRLGGGFALDGPLDGDPLAGALGGMFKTAQREWPDARTKWIDLPAAASDTNELARRIVDELLCDGPLEVGFVGGRSHAIVLEPRSFHPAAEAPIRSTDVVVASGGARGVTAEAILALAREWRCKFLLLGRSAEPCVEPAWLAGVEGEAEIKRAIAASSDRRMAPTELQKEYRRWSANREIVANLRRIEAAGGTVVYRSLDVRDRNAAADAIDEARRTLGPIRGLVHGAGVLFDRRIEDQTPEQFAEVLSTKIDALAALLSATEADDLRSIALFSSSTARFGRVGQIAYAAANEAMNKMARRIAIDRPAARVASVNWGPWDGGMVDERLKKLFASEGVGVIDFEQGARLLIAEMSAQVDEPIETVVVGSLDAIQSDPIETAPVAAASHLPGGKFPGERCPDEPIDDEPMHLAFARRLSVDDYPLLRSHVVGRHAVLPMATTIEWLAHGAMHDNPGLVFCGFDDLRIYKGVTLDAGQTASIDIHAGRAQFEGGYERVHVLLRSGSALHAGATILLGAELPSDQPSDQPTPDGPYSQPATSAYSSGRLFHGPLLEAIERVESCDGSGIVGVLRAASTPSEWMPAPMRSSWIADPLALDGGFQLMILWCCELCGAASLPTSAAGYRQFRRSYPADGTTCVVRVVHRREHMAEATIEWLDRRGELVARMDGYQCVIDPSLAAAFAQNELIQRVEA